jgi:hypothetical protein
MLAQLDQKYQNDSETHELLAADVAPHLQSELTDGTKILVAHSDAEWRRI